jgi:hypothetical protein
VSTPTYHRGQRNYGTGYDMMERIDRMEQRSQNAVEILRKGFKSCDPTVTASAIILAISELSNE